MSEIILIDDNTSNVLEYIEVNNTSQGTIDPSGDMIVISEYNSRIPTLHPRYVAENIVNKKNDLTNPNTTGYTSTLAVYNALLLKADKYIAITGQTSIGNGISLSNGIENNNITLKSLTSSDSVNVSGNSNTINFNINLNSITGFTTTTQFNEYTGQTKIVLDDKLNNVDFYQYTGDTDNRLGLIENNINYISGNTINTQNFNIYTGETENIINDINNSINIVSGETNNKLDVIVFNQYTGNTSVNELQIISTGITNINIISPTPIIWDYFTTKDSYYFWSGGSEIKIINNGNYELLYKITAMNDMTSVPRSFGAYVLRNYNEFLEMTLSSASVVSGNAIITVVSPMIQHTLNANDILQVVTFRTGNDGIINTIPNEVIFQIKSSNKLI